ncbi:MAG: transposase family protein [Modestobacter sp.]|nr:transposase family protein [Modestobacter sp.]
MAGRHGQYPPELRERAVRLVADHASEWEAMRSVAQKLGIGTTETVRKWVRRAEVAGARPGVTSEESAGGQQPTSWCPRGDSLQPHTAACGEVTDRLTKATWDRQAVT